MDQIQLQQKIAEYFQKLPKEAQDVFSSMLWMEKLKEINVKYGLKENQIKVLATETTLVLLGIIHIEEYQNILRKDLGLEKELVEKMLLEIDENILKTIKVKLTETFHSNTLSLIKESMDKRFSSLPNEVQEAIALSGWKESIYEIAKKYGLNIEKTGMLEEITVNTLCNIIKTEQYESEIKSKIGLPDDKNKEMVIELNEKIFKNIKDLMESNSSFEENGEQIPIPPYMAKKVEEVPIPTPAFASPPAKGEMPEGQRGSEEIENIISNKELNTKEADIYKESGIEIVEDVPIVQRDTLKEVIPENEIKKIEKVIEKKEETAFASPPAKGEIPEGQRGSSIILDKLLGNTTSKTTVSDYSLPKISTQTPEKPHDPYHEAI